MKFKLLLLLSVVTLGLIVSCDVAENNQTTDIEDAIMKVISADDSTYGIEGLGNIEDEDYSLGKALEGTQVAIEPSVLSLRDSNYVWRFGRSGMEAEREITIEVEDDSSALALISHHITGIFHIRQFERVWTAVDTWEMGDSVRFSQKAINMTTHRRVAFKKRLNAAGLEQWKPIAMTLLTGHSGESLDIEALEWVAEDSTLILTDFDTVLYDRRHPLLLSRVGVNQVNVVLSNNDLEDEAEMVTGRLGYHPQLNGPDSRSRFLFHYVETLGTGDKVYSQRIIPVRVYPRNFKGFVEAIDYRTLFDHDYPDYTSATLGFIYTTREHVRP